MLCCTRVVSRCTRVVFRYVVLYSCCVALLLVQFSRLDRDLKVLTSDRITSKKYFHIYGSDYNIYMSLFRYKILNHVFLLYKKLNGRGIANMELQMIHFALSVEQLMKHLSICFMNVTESNIYLISCVCYFLDVLILSLSIRQTNTIGITN